MGWKNNLEHISWAVQRIEKLLRVLQGQTAVNSKRIEAMRVLLDQQIKNQSRAADRMGDRLIEMAMVNQGGSREAASHRRTLDEKPVEEADLWQDNPETQWPPPNCDAIIMP